MCQTSTALKAYSVWSIVKFFAVAAIILYVAKTRRDAIIDSQSSVDRCQTCYDQMPGHPALWFEMGRCNARFPNRFPRDDAHSQALLERSFFSFQSWTGRVSEANYLVYFGAIYLCLLVLMCILWFIHPFATNLWESPVWASFTVFFANLQGVAGLMGLHWFYRMWPLEGGVANAADGSAATCYVSLWEPSLVTTNMIAGVAVIVVLLVVALIAMLALKPETMHLATAAVSAVFSTLYFAFVLWWLASGLSRTRDWWLLSVAVASGFTGLEVLFFSIAHPSKGEAVTYSGI